MSSLSEKFDKFLASKTSKPFDPDAFGDEEREVYESEAIDVGKSRLRSSAPLFEQSTKYKGKKINRKEIFDVGKDDDEDSEVDDVKQKKVKSASNPKKLTDKERAIRLEESLKFGEDLDEDFIEQESDDDDDDGGVVEDDSDDKDTENDEEDGNGKDVVVHKKLKIKPSKRKEKRLNYEEEKEEEDDDDEEEMNSSEDAEDTEETDDDDDDEEDEEEDDSNNKKLKTGVKVVSEEITDLRENASEAILKQYGILEALMDIRLSQQEMLFKANQLPRPPQHKLFKQCIGKDFTDIVNSVTSQFGQMLKNVLEFEDYNLKAAGISSKSNQKSNGGADDDDIEITSDEDDGEDGNDDDDLTNGAKVKKMSIGNEAGIEDNDEDGDDDDDEDDEEEDGEDDDEEKDDDNDEEKDKTNKKDVNKKIKLYKEKLKSNEKEYKAYMVKVLAGLSEKWKFATKSKAQDFSSFYIPMHKQIEQILQDRSRLLERTRIKRSVYNVLGAGTNAADKEDEEPQAAMVVSRKRMMDEDVEVFDDGDFYQKLLMEKTKRKTSSATDMTFISKQWAELERMRGAVKKDVDHRATKGRKTRYEIHKKMAGFMAPCKPKTLLSDQQIDAFLEHIASVHNQQPEKSA